MAKEPPKLDFENATQEERDNWYRDYEVQCPGSEGNTADRCGWLKRKYEEWGLAAPDILDFPCHDGYVTRGFMAQGARILGFDIGVDAIAKSIEIAGKRYPLEFGYEWEYELSSSNDFDWDGYHELFDLTVCFEFIEHIPKDAVSTLLKQLHHVTAEGGYVAISTPEKYGPYGDCGDRGAHINCYTAETLRQQIKDVLGIDAEIEADKEFVFASWRKE